MAMAMRLLTGCAQRRDQKPHEGQLPMTNHDSRIPIRFSARHGSMPRPFERTTSSASRSSGGGGDAGGPAVPVLFIAGIGRSGSTLLDRLLGSAPKLHSGGEIGGVWTQGLVCDRLCSCGVRFSVCPFWQAVGSSSFSSLQTHEVDAIVSYLDRVLPTKKMWLLLSRRTRRRLVRSAPANFFEMTSRLYQGILAVSTRQVVVDSSKLATYLMLLTLVPSADVRVVHLVRDPRAVMHSWLKLQVADPDGRSSMPRCGVATSIVLWLINNAAVEWIAQQLALPYVRVRYEDLVRDPSQVVRKLWSEFAMGNTELGCVEADPPNCEGVDFGVIHSISGNPMRFRQGRALIVEDADWKADPKLRRAIVAAITLPLRWRYGYGGPSVFRYRMKRC